MASSSDSGSRASATAARSSSSVCRGGVAREIKADEIEGDDEEEQAPDVRVFSRARLAFGLLPAK